MPYSAQTYLTNMSDLSDFDENTPFGEITHVGGVSKVKMKNATFLKLSGHDLIGG